MQEGKASLLSIEKSMQMMKMVSYLEKQQGNFSKIKNYHVSSYSTSGY